MIFTIIFMIIIPTRINCTILCIYSIYRKYIYWNKCYS